MRFKLLLLAVLPLTFALEVRVTITPNHRKFLIGALSKSTSPPAATFEGAEGKPAAQRLTILHRPNASNAIPVNFTIFLPANCSQAEMSQPVQQQQQQWCHHLPILFLINGANVRAQDYTTYATLLTERGYTFVASDYYQTLPPALANTTLPDICPKGKLLASSAGLIRTFLNYANATNNTMFQGIERRGIVLIGHSMGGTTILDVLDGTCAKPYNASTGLQGIDTCEAYQPSIRTSRPNAINSNSSTVACPAPGNAVVMPGVVLGAVVFEGFKSRSPPPGAPPTAYTPIGISLPPGTFLLYMAGMYGINRTSMAYQDTNATACACAGLAAFSRINHFGINDWQPNGKQITPCGRKASFDPANFTIAAEVHNAQLQRMAALTDQFIRAAVFKSQKLQTTASPGYTLQLKGQCYA